MRPSLILADTCSTQTLSLASLQLPCGVLPKMHPVIEFVRLLVLQCHAVCWSLNFAVSLAGMGSVLVAGLGLRFCPFWKPDFAGCCHWGDPSRTEEQADSKRLWQAGCLLTPAQWHVDMFFILNTLHVRLPHVRQVSFLQQEARECLRMLFACEKPALKWWWRSALLSWN